MSDEYEIPTQQEVDDALFDCARFGDLDDLKEMKSTDDTNMLNFSAVDAQGSNAFHMAAANGHITMLQYLKENGTTYVKNNSGHCPLTWAIINKQTATVKWLLENFSDSIDVLFKPEHGPFSPLSQAQDVEAHDIVELLLKHHSADKLEERDLEVSDDDEDVEKDGEITPDTTTTTTANTPEPDTQ